MWQKNLPGVGNTSCSCLPGLHLPLGEMCGGDAPAQRLRPVFLVQLKLETRDKHVPPLFLILTNELKEGFAMLTVEGKILASIFPQCGSGMFIPNLNFSIPDPGFRVKKIPKNLFLSSQVPDLNFFPIPDPGVKKAPDPGSGTLVFFAVYI
jgi:hypothetical protein